MSNGRFRRDLWSGVLFEPPDSPGDESPTRELVSSASRSQLVVAIKDFKNELTIPVRDVVGSFLPKLGVEDPRTPMGFSRASKVPPGSLYGEIVNSRFLNPDGTCALPARFRDPRWKAKPVRPAGASSLPNSPRKRASPRTDGKPLDKQKSRSLANTSVQRSAQQLADADLDGDGMDPDEFRNFLRARLDGTPELEELNALEAKDPKQVETWFKCLDKDGGGRLSKAELFGFSLKEAATGAGHANVSKLLKSYPELTRGTISLDSLASVVVKLGFDEGTAAEIFVQIDKDKSGVINQGELEAWAVTATKNGDFKALDGTRPLDSLASLLERGRDRQGNMDVKKRSQRRKSYKLAEDESPHLLGIQNKLGKVLPTEEDVVEAASLGKELKSRIRAEARKTHTTILDMLCLWDLNEDGTVTMKELHQAIVLIGLTEVTAPVVQALFDQISAGEYKLGVEVIVEWAMNTEDIEEKIASGHMLTDDELYQLKKANAKNMEDLSTKLSSGHMLSDDEIAQLRAASVDGLTEKIEKGQMLTDDELEQLKAASDASMDTLAKKLADGQILSSDELAQLKAASKANNEALEEKLGDGKLLTADELAEIKKAGSVSLAADVVVADQEAAATKVQAAIRGKAGRGKATEVGKAKAEGEKILAEKAAAEKEAAEKEAAATRMQSLHRGRAARGRAADKAAVKRAEAKEALAAANAPQAATPATAPAPAPATAAEAPAVAEEEAPAVEEEGGVAVAELEEVVDPPPQEEEEAEAPAEELTAEAEPEAAEPAAAEPPAEEVAVEEATVAEPEPEPEAEAEAETPAEEAEAAPVAEEEAAPAEEAVAEEPVDAS